MFRLMSKRFPFLIRISTFLRQEISEIMRQTSLICSRFLIRMSAFLLKEIFEIMRQPLLILTLVLGPFLILLFFGIGYRNEARALRTLFVVVEDNALAQRIEQYASSLGAQLIFAGITDDLESAQERLRQGEADLVIVIPSDAYGTIRNNEQAVIFMYHREIDPFQSDYISVFARVYVGEVNRQVLRFITSEGQLNASGAPETLEAARSSAASLRELLERCAAALTESENDEQCNSVAARQYLQELDRHVDELVLVLQDSLRLNDVVLQGVNGETSRNVDPESLPSLADISQGANELAELELEELELEGLEARIDNYLSQLQILARLETDLMLLEEKLLEFLDIDPKVLISPFRGEPRNIASVGTRITDFFAPSVIVLLLQHLTVTFAALTMVRERLLGSMELFNVSPLSAVETLLGKYLSFLLFGVILTVVLFALVAFVGVPILGSLLSVGLVIIGLLFTSLGIGFIISLLSKTDIQAVQYSMIVLLMSVFFSGFLLDLESLRESVRVISWALPATYGILLLRNIMLRGDPLALASFMQLVAIGLGLFLVAWALLRRSMAHII
jgi:ABC-2 type transport system permease protein